MHVGCNIARLQFSVLLTGLFCLVLHSNFGDNFVGVSFLIWFPRANCFLCWLLLSSFGPRTGHLWLYFPWTPSACRARSWDFYQTKGSSLPERRRARGRNHAAQASMYTSHIISFSWDHQSVPWAVGPWNFRSSLIATIMTKPMWKWSVQFLSTIEFEYDEKG